MRTSYVGFIATARKRATGGRPWRTDRARRLGRSPAFTSSSMRWSPMASSDALGQQAGALALDAQLVARPARDLVLHLDAAVGRLEGEGVARCAP